MSPAMSRSRFICAGHVLCRRPVLCLLVAFLACVSAGCNYDQSGKYSATSNGQYKWQSLYREDVQTVYVPIFSNKDFHQGVENRLTQAVVQQIESRTPYKVSSRDRADTILEGEIVSVGFNTISVDTKSVAPQEQLLTLKVNFTWKNLRTGAILHREANFEQSVTYYPTLGEGQFVGQQEAIEKLAIGIVQSMEAKW